MIDNKNNGHDSTKTDIRIKFYIIIVQLLLLVSFIGSWKIYLTGNQYIVSNTLNNIYFSSALLIIGSLISGYTIWKLSPRVDRIQFNYFPATLGCWLFIIPIILTIYAGNYLNLKLKEGNFTKFDSEVIDKSGDPIMRNYWLTIKYNDNKEKIAMPKQHWNQYSITDSITLLIGKGYFGYDIIRYEQMK